MIEHQTNIGDTSRTNMESKPSSSMTVQPAVESSTWVIMVGRHHMKCATVKLLASFFHPWNSHGCDFVGRQQHGQSPTGMRNNHHFDLLDRICFSLAQADQQHRVDFIVVAGYAAAAM